MMSVINTRHNRINARTCRICLDAKSDDMVLIEEQNGWLKLFEFCFGFTLTTQDEPRLLCQICAEKVQSYVKFKEKCQKSHSLWKLVISDVTCNIIKHEDVETPPATKENADDPITNTKHLKNETFDSLFDDDTHFSTNDDITMVNISPAEIRTEIDDDKGTRTRDEESNIEKSDCIVGNKDDTKQRKFQIVSVSNGCVKSAEKKVYTCAKCKCSYGRKYWYLRHIKVCQAKRKKLFYNQEYSFDLGRKYDGPNIDIVKQELQNIEIVRNQFSCGLCNLSFSDAKDLYIHLDDHWSNNNLECKLCDFVGIDLAAIISHRFSHLPRKKMHFVCHICEKPRHSLLALHFHYRGEHLKKAGGYCSRCNKEYNKLCLWKKHERTHHTPKYMCDICDKEFSYKSNITAHMIDHMQLDKSVCDICGKVMSRQRYLKAHKETVHYQSGPIKCNHCDRMFKSQFSLKQHQKNVAREKTMVCEVCLKTFISITLLKKHMIAHTDERPFSCDLCGSNYKRKSQLTEHLQKHNGIVPQCPLCMKTFSNARSLSRHSSVHTGVRRYSCKVANCEKTFNMKKQMLAHLKLRHKDEMLENKEVLQEKIV